jgi:hypothetical protein
MVKIIVVLFILAIVTALLYDDGGDEDGILSI